MWWLVSRYLASKSQVPDRPWHRCRFYPSTSDPTKPRLPEENQWQAQVGPGVDIYDSTDQSGPSLEPLTPQASGIPHWNTHRSEEHTSELQSRFDLVCRLLLEKKKQKKYTYY